MGLNWNRLGHTHLASRPRRHGLRSRLPKTTGYLSGDYALGIDDATAEVRNAFANNMLRVYATQETEEALVLA